MRECAGRFIASKQSLSRVITTISLFRGTRLYELIESYDIPIYMHIYICVYFSVVSFSFLIASLSRRDFAFVRMNSRALFGEQICSERRFVYLKEDSELIFMTLFFFKFFFIVFFFVVVEHVTDEHGKRVIAT